MRYGTRLAAVCLTAASALLSAACFDLDVRTSEPFSPQTSQPPNDPDPTVEAKQCQGVLAPQLLSPSVIDQDTAARTLAVHGDRVYVVDPDNHQVVAMRRSGDQLAVTATIPVGGTPYRLAVLPSGDVWVSLRDTGELVQLLRSRGGYIVNTVPVGLDAAGFAAHPSGNLLYVTVPATNELVQVDPVARLVTRRVPTEVEPRAVAVGRLPTGGTYVTVIHRAAPALLISLDPEGRLGTSEAFLALKQRNPWQKEFPTDAGQLPAARRALSATVDPVTGEALVAHVTVNSGVPAFALFNLPDTPPAYYNPASITSNNIPGRPIETAISRLARGVEPGSGQTPGIISNGGREAIINLLHAIDQPVDIRHHPTLSFVFVVGHGTDNVVGFNTRSDVLDPTMFPGQQLLTGRGPSGIAFSPDGRWAYVDNAYDHTVTLFGLDYLFVDALGDTIPNSCSAWIPEYYRAARSDRTFAYAKDSLPPDVARGRRLFHSATNPRLSAAGRMACATCHTEGDQDGMVWSGIDGSRQTPALAGRLHDTAPFNWKGSEGSLEGNMGLTVSRMGGTGATADELADLKAFLLEGLVVPPNPHLSDAGLSAEQEHGRTLFMDPQVGCAQCHVPPAFTDGRQWAVGVSSMLDALVAATPTFNTPSLRQLWRTAPYLHDGSASTLHEVLDLTEGTMGSTSHLLDSDRDALVAYLLTL